MVDIDAAVGYVVAHGDDIDRARLAWLRCGTAPSDDLIDKAATGQTVKGGWPPLWDARAASVDATCFRLCELDDLGALGRAPARAALAWLASQQREDGTWEEDPSLAAVAPQWARPGDLEATLYLTANAAFWLAVSGPPPRTASSWGTSEPDNEYAEAVTRAGEVFRGALEPDGSWSSYLATAWLGGALLYYLGSFYESAKIQVALAERVPDLSAADVASLAATMRRVGMSVDDWLLVAARRRLADTQHSDGRWESDIDQSFDVHTTLTAIRALL